jgi:A118 family predicted phage portal protein
MPLPPSNIPWPPQELAPVTDRMAQWDAWYTGDPDTLAGVYGGQLGMDPGQTGFFASQRGGIASRVATAFVRWFWGKPVTPGEQRTKLHVPLASDIARTSASLLFSEPPKLRSGDKPTQARLDELVDDGMHATILESAEQAAAIGGTYLRVCWDRALYDAPWTDAVAADMAVPEWQWGRLAAVTFWRVVGVDGNSVWRHLEKHEPGFILHGLYKGDRKKLGVPVPLEDSPVTAPLAALVNDAGAIPTGITQLTATYIPNIRPNRLWRNIPTAARLGRSDFAGVEPLMDSLDETYSSWMRDIRNGRGRVIVPQSMLTSNGPGKGASFDAEREIYTGMNMMQRPGDAGKLDIVQFEIRVEQHRDTAQDLVEQIVRSAGYSAQSFGAQGDVAVTATEVVARNRQSFTTKAAKGLYWRPGLVDHIEALLAIDKAVYGTAVSGDDIDVELSDGLTEDPQTTATTASLLRTAQAASTDTLVRMVNPEWDDDEVTAEVDRITGEHDLGPVADPAAIGPGGNGLNIGG